MARPRLLALPFLFSMAKPDDNDAQSAGELSGWRLVRGSYAFVIDRTVSTHRRTHPATSWWPEFWGVSVVALLIVVNIIGVLLALGEFLAADELLNRIAATRAMAIASVATCTIIVAAIFLPNRRYRDWSTELQARVRFAREKPAHFEAVIYAITAIILLAGMALGIVI